MLEIAGIVAAVLGLVLAIAGYRGDRSRGRRRCPRCWYTVDDAVGRKCSECGHEARRERDLLRARRRWRVVWLGVLLLAIAQIGWMGPRYRRGGWVALVPTEALILVMPCLPHQWIWGTAKVGEDWSLLARLEGLEPPQSRTYVRAWRWHGEWARERAVAWLRSADSAAEAHDALGVCMQFEHAQDDAFKAALVHALAVGLDGVAGREPGSWHLLTEITMVLRTDWDSPADGFPEVSSLIDQRQEELLGLPPRLGFDSAELLQFGSAPPELVDRFFKQQRLHGIVCLARRHESVRWRLLSQANIEHEPDRVFALQVIGRACIDFGWKDGMDALVRALESDDSAGALAAVSALDRLAGSATTKRVVARVLVLLERDPTLDGEVYWALGPRMRVELSREAEALIGIAGGESPHIERLIVRLAATAGSSAWRPKLDAEAVRLLDSGIPVPPDIDAESIEQLRARVEAQEVRGW